MLRWFRRLTSASDLLDGRFSLPVSKDGKVISWVSRTDLDNLIIHYNNKRPRDKLDAQTLRVLLDFTDLLDRIEA